MGWGRWTRKVITDHDRREDRGGDDYYCLKLGHYEAYDQPLAAVLTQRTARTFKPTAKA